METDKFCPNCGKSVPAGTAFCGECGYKVSRGEKTVPMASVPTPAATAPPPVKMQPMYVTSTATQIARQEVYTEEWSSCQDIYHKIPFSEEAKKKYFTYHGRLNRWTYFCRSIVIGFFCLLTIGVMAGLAAAIGGAIGVILGILCIPIYIAVLVPAFMLQIRRWHDVNKTGWLCLATMIPYLGFLAAIYMLFAPGTKGPNQYGEDPLEGRR